MSNGDPLDTPFWTFSLAVYGSPGVAAECLALQDRYELDVNLLLLAAYAGAADGVTLAIDDISAAFETIAQWHSDVVRSLREARRALKPMSEDQGDPLRAAASALRTQTQKAEIEAERVEQAMLWAWMQRHLPKRPHGDRGAALAANLTAVLAFYRAEADAEQATPNLREAALRCSADTQR
ncbi:MAG TPA: TIGR02444 family protein [Pseudolabrys sp.]|nr:TIGR02444 family protein [Pseudolabrys sp.]